MAGSPAIPFQTSLFPAVERAVSSRARPSLLPASSQLWAALYLPQLALEVLRGHEEESPWVVVELVQGRQVVHAASALAAASGVVAQMPLASAYALCPELGTEWRDVEAEQSAMTLLADWAGRYTSMVSLAPRALLLEIGASLKLFGGLEALLEDMAREQVVLGHYLVQAVAPTPQAALLLSRCGGGRVLEREALRTALGAIPLAALPVTDKQAALFQRLGLDALRDIWRLPRDGLSRRFGVEFTDYLAQLLGERAEPRQAHLSAASFCAAWSFPLETDNMTFILHGIRSLLPALVRFMRSRQLALNTVQLRFYHSGRAASQISVGMQQLCSEEVHLFSLIEARLEAEFLAAPVLELELVADEFHTFVATAPGLFELGEGEAPQWRQLLDQLQVRLGAEAVRRLAVRSEHRPERAWRYGEGEPSVTLPSTGERPLWLLPEPQPMPNAPGNLRLCSDPERIEGGWWDEADVRRDYYVALDGSGRRLWVFRDLRDGAWYLHGLFG